MKALDLLFEWPSVQPHRVLLPRGRTPRARVTSVIPSPPNSHPPPCWEDFPPCWSERLKSRKSEMPRADLSVTHIFHSSWALTSQKGSWTSGEGGGWSFERSWADWMAAQQRSFISPSLIFKSSHRGCWWPFTGAQRHGVLRDHPMDFMPLFLASSSYCSALGSPLTCRS